MRFNDAIIGCVLVIFAIAEIAYTQTFPSLFGQRYGPALFPQLIGLGLIASGIVLVVRGVIQKRRAGAEGRWLDMQSWAGNTHQKTNLVLVLLALLAYILLSDWLGFILLSMLTLSVLLYRLGSSITVALAIASATTAALYLMFAKLLLVPLPAGLLQGLLY
jgi:putative tricarboxylic transport membrane protein